MVKAAASGAVGKGPVEQTRHDWVSRVGGGYYGAGVAYIGARLGLTAPRVMNCVRDGFPAAHWMTLNEIAFETKFTLPEFMCNFSADHKPGLTAPCMMETMPEPKKKQVPRKKHVKIIRKPGVSSRGSR